MRILSAFALSGLLVSVSPAQAQSSNPFASSPPSYPSPWMSKDGEWAEAYSKAKAFVSQLTLLEKVNLTTGTGYGSNQCLGSTGELPRLGFPGLCMQYVPINTSFADYTTAFPAGINVGATWDRGLAYARAAAIGAELKQKGTDVVLTPQVSPLGRYPEGGRNWESFGPDPYLTGEMVTPTVQGIQDNGLVATTRHFIGNEQEHFRQASEALQNGFNISRAISENLDDRTLHEVYLWPFANAVRAGTGAIMAAYNQVNNTYSSQNSWALNRILKSELGFQGFVMSDWGGQYSGSSSAVAGLDMSMTGDFPILSGASFWGTNLTIAVANGTVPEWRLDDMCMRIMAAYYKVGRDKDHVPVNLDSWTIQTNAPAHLYDATSPVVRVNEDVLVRQPSHRNLVREIGRASAVLLKNTGSLPLTGKEHHVALVGNDAGTNPQGANGCINQACSGGTLAQGWGSGSVLYPYLTTPEQAITNYVITQTNGSVQTVTNNSADGPIADLTTQASVSIVFVNADSGEGFATVDGNYGDRNNLSLWGQGDELIQKVVKTCNNTIVVMHTVGPVLMSDWYDNENVTAILWAGLPGQETGNSLVDVLYGAYNPSGKLPFTIGPDRKSYGPELVYEPNNSEPNGAPQADISGLDIDYRRFDARNITPTYEFGFGLSYTTFAYSNLEVEPLPDAARYEATLGMTDPAPRLGNATAGSSSSNITTIDPKDLLFPPNDTLVPAALYIYPYLTSTDFANASRDADYGTLAPSEFLPRGYDDADPQPRVASGGAPGGNPGLWQAVANVSATLANTGGRAGHEVVQVYVALEPEGCPNSMNSMNDTAGGDAGSDPRFSPSRVLRGFERLWIESGASATYTAQLLRRDVSTWDVVRQDWVMCDRVTVYVGSSSRKLPLKAELSLR